MLWEVETHVHRSTRDFSALRNKNMYKIQMTISCELKCSPSCVSRVLSSSMLIRLSVHAADFYVIRRMSNVGNKERSLKIWGQTGSRFMQRSQNKPNWTTELLRLYKEDTFLYSQLWFNSGSEVVLTVLFHLPWGSRMFFENKFDVLKCVLFF